MGDQLSIKAGLHASLICAAALTQLSGCEAQRRASENTAVQKEAAQEIKRICALPPTERDAEIKRIKTQSGIVVTCGKQ